MGDLLTLGQMLAVHARLHCVRTLAEGGSIFTSLVPTHYAMMLDLPAAVRARHDLGRVTKLMISSAPPGRRPSAP